VNRRSMRLRGRRDSVTGQTTFSDFMKLEYEHMVDAHMNATDKLTSFFRYMLLIYSAPLLLLARTDELHKWSPWVFTAIAVVGFAVTMYMSKLRFETLLYARTVNGVRRYFLDRYGDLDFVENNEYRVLPSQKSIPQFADLGQFNWIIVAAGFVNGVYLYLGLTSSDKLLAMTSWLTDLYVQAGLVRAAAISPSLVLKLAGVLLALLYIWLHRLSFELLARHEEGGMSFFNHVVGVDIDGVLNEHCKQFCEVLERLTKKSIRPEQITRMPVRYAGIGVTEEDERKVFESREYWKTMPPKPGAATELKRVRDVLGFQIHAFSWRPWKVERCRSLKRATKKWLSQNDFDVDRLTIEKGNLGDPVGVDAALYRSRFYVSKRRRIQFFIEDDLDKARSLSNICRAVFLMDQPYNGTDQLPHNVIRVREWHEIFDILKRLC
jgi:uncharacterized HAD superfamily protein